MKVVYMFCSMKVSARRMALIPPAARYPPPASGFPLLSDCPRCACCYREPLFWCYHHITFSVIRFLGTKGTADEFHIPLPRQPAQPAQSKSLTLIAARSLAELSCWFLYPQQCLHARNANMLKDHACRLGGCPSMQAGPGDVSNPAAPVKTS